MLSLMGGSITPLLDATFQAKEYFRMSATSFGRRSRAVFALVLAILFALATAATSFASGGGITQISRRTVRASTRRKSSLIHFLLARPLFQLSRQDAFSMEGVPMSVGPLPPTTVRRGNLVSCLVQPFTRSPRARSPVRQTRQSPIMLKTRYG